MTTRHTEMADAPGTPYNGAPATGPLPSLGYPASPPSEQQSNHLQEQDALLARVVLTSTIQHNPSKQDFMLLLGWISVG